MGGVPLESVVVIGLVVFVGAFVQSAVGVGSGMVGTPVVALVEPTLVPTLLLLVTIQISLGVLVTHHRHVDWRALAWSLPARVPGTVVGVWLVTSLATATLGVAIGILVLAMVGVAWRSVALPRTPGTLVAAGFTSGATGTAAAIDGPPMVVLFAHRPPEEVRATMSMFFLMGAVLSLVGFALQDALPAASVWLALAYVPLVLLAVSLGGWASRSLPRESFRHAVLAVCALSATVLLGKSLG